MTLLILWMLFVTLRSSLSLSSVFLLMLVTLAISLLSLWPNSVQLVTLIVLFVTCLGSRVISLIFFARLRIIIVVLKSWMSFVLNVLVCRTLSLNCVNVMQNLSELLKILIFLLMARRKVRIRVGKFGK